MRHLEICRGDFKKTSHLRSLMLGAARTWLTGNEFLEIQVPHITGATGSCEWFPNAMSVTMFNELGAETDMFLRQTGQLYLEAFTVAHNRVYTIGSSFRQERKVTDRHLCEFTLIEFEGRDFELDGLMDNVEGLIKAMYAATPEWYRSEALEHYQTESFNRITYGDLVALLQSNGFALKYGDDLGSAEEKAACHLLGNLPTFVTHYPADPRPEENGVIKFFSMKRDGDQTLCCDLLLPEVGESVGGAVREGDPAICKKQFEESYMYDHLIDRGVDPKQFEWYFEILGQEDGQSSGCGIGFERVVQSILAPLADGQSTIKTAVELPRSPEYLRV